MNIVFMGTAELACPSLQALCGLHGHRVVGVFTQPDRPAGRDQQLTMSPVKKVAMVRRIPIFQPEKLREGAAFQALRELEPDLIVVVAYGQILRREVLDFPPLGCVNVHASLLPRWRGAAPIQWAILSGDAETGVTTMKMDEGLDTGPILLQARTPIFSDDTAASLHDRLADIGAELLLKTFAGLEQGALQPKPQNDAVATYAKKLSKEDGHIVWSESAEQICRKVRAFNPWPGAFCLWTKEASDEPEETRRLVKIWRAETQAGTPVPPIRTKAGEVLSASVEGIVVAAGDGEVRVTELQLEGRKRMSAGEFLRGHKLEAGMKLS